MACVRTQYFRYFQGHYILDMKNEMFTSDKTFRLDSIVFFSPTGAQNVSSSRKNNFFM